jgi:hypothetical protein
MTVTVQPKPTFEVGDRVQRLDLSRQDGSVITGLRGTVIGVYKLRVRWDETAVTRAQVRRFGESDRRVNFYAPEHLAPAVPEGPEASQ